METEQKLMMVVGPVVYLRQRADAYWHDSHALLEIDPPMAVAYRAIADELRTCAAEIERQS